LKTIVPKIETGFKITPAIKFDFTRHLFHFCKKVFFFQLVHLCYFINVIIPRSSGSDGSPI